MHNFFLNIQIQFWSNVVFFFKSKAEFCCFPCPCDPDSDGCPQIPVRAEPRHLWVSDFTPRRINP